MPCHYNPITEQVFVAVFAAVSWAEERGLCSLGLHYVLASESSAWPGGLNNGIDKHTPTTAYGQRALASWVWDQGFLADMGQSSLVCALVASS